MLQSKNQQGGVGFILDGEAENQSLLLIVHPCDALSHEVWYSTKLSPGLASAPLSEDFGVFMVVLPGVETHPSHVYLIYDSLVPD